MQATHGTYTVVKTERAPPKRARPPAPPPKPSGAAAALLKATFFLTPTERRAAAQDPPAPAAAPAAEEAALESEEAAAAPAPPPPAPLEEPAATVDAAPLAAGWSLLPSLQRAVMALVSEVRNLPVRVLEAMGPPLSHPASETIIREVLNHHFGVDTSGRQKTWHFTQRSSNGQNSLFASRSKVLRRHDAEPAKHAFMAQ